jgi:hypothetical protein
MVCLFDILISVYPAAERYSQELSKPAGKAALYSSRNSIFLSR